MLVLSRRIEEEIVFPAIGVTVKILRAQANRARLGIQAPPYVEVARREVVVDTSSAPADHKLRNGLNAVVLHCEMFRRQVELGRPDEAHQSYLRMMTMLRQIDSEFASSQPGEERIDVDHPARRRVLVVEDDANERELLAGLLRMEGLDVSIAADGREALTILATSPRPDFVLLDIGLPRVDGRETLEVIRTSPEVADLSVFVVSGRRPAEVGVTVGGPNGADRWFEKPLNPTELVAAIRDDEQSTASLTA